MRSAEASFAFPELMKLLYEGNAIAANMATIPTETISSMSVNPGECRREIVFLCGVFADILSGLHLKNFSRITIIYETGLKESDKCQLNNSIFALLVMAGLVR